MKTDANHFIGKRRQMQMSLSANEDSCTSLHQQMKTDANQLIGT